MKEKLIKIKNDLSELEIIVSNVDVIAEEWNFPPKVAFNLNLVLEELVTNTIFYGYGDHTNSKQEIEINLSFDGETLTIKLIDGAQAFDPLQKDEPKNLYKSIEEREFGGLGIYMVKNLMDEIEYKRENERNILILKTKI